jgi:hypothetical protein
MKQLWIWILTHVYKLSIVRIQTLDKGNIIHYERLRTLGVVTVDSNQGPFTFTFKEDRRSRIREKQGIVLRITSYFVELRCPDSVPDSNIFHQKAILVVKLKIKRTNYDALGKVLLKTYLDALKVEPI